MENSEMQRIVMALAATVIWAATASPSPASASAQDHVKARHAKRMQARCQIDKKLTDMKEEPRNRVVQVRRFGGPDGLEVVEAPLPTAGRGEVRVRVLASSVQYTDVTITWGSAPLTVGCCLRLGTFIWGIAAP